MPPPSRLAIATSSVTRLVKEEASYHKELVQQEQRLEKTKNEMVDENAEFKLRQERQAIEETKAIFGPLRERLATAVAHLELQLAQAESEGSADSASEITKAKNALGQAGALK